jgi:hypothetical protein
MSFRMLERAENSLESSYDSMESWRGVGTFDHSKGTRVLWWKHGATRAGARGEGSTDSGPQRTPSGACQAPMYRREHPCSGPLASRIISNGLGTVAILPFLASGRTVVR